MFTRFSQLSCIAAFGASCAVSLCTSAAVITDRTLVSGTNAIDPAENEQVDQVALGATPASTLTALAGFAAVQDFSGFVAKNNILAFTDPTRPDVALNLTASVGDSGGYNGNTALSTSDGGAVQLREKANGGKTLVYTINFGSYDSLTETFTDTVAGPRAAGFTLSNIDSVWSNAKVTFTLSNGSTVEQTIVSGAEAGGGNTDAYAGLDANTISAGLTIDQIQFRASYAGGNVDASIGFDDLGFTTIPEPASALLLAIAPALLCSRSRQAV